MKLFLSSSGISLRRYCQKNSYQKRGVQKKAKKEGWSYSGGLGGGGGGGVYRKGIRTSAHYALKCFKIKLCDKSWI